MPAAPLHLAGSGVSVVAASNGKGSPIGSILIFVLLLAGVGFLFVNGRRRSRAVQAQQSEIAIGSTIVTRAGMIATLVHQTEHYVVLQLDDGTRTRFVPQAVARVWEEPSDELSGDAADSGRDSASDRDSDRDSDRGSGSASDMVSDLTAAAPAPPEPPAGPGPLAD